MSGGLFPRLHTWVANESLVYSDLNAEYDNIISHLQPIYLDCYSHSVSEMQITRNPGAVGTESLAQSTADEIAELRYCIQRLGGVDLAQWYSAPPTDLTSLNNILNTGGQTPVDYITACHVRASDNRPDFLLANGANRTFKLQATSTNFKYLVASNDYTVTSDITSANVALAPSSNNTATLAAAMSGQGNDAYVFLSSPGSSISGAAGKVMAFKVESEYFMGLVGVGGTTISNVIRGTFIDSTGANVTFAGHTSTTTVTILDITWVFINTSGSLILLDSFSNSTPTVSQTAPVSPVSGDYWFSLGTGTWFTYSGSSWVASNALLIGVVISDTADCVASVSYDTYKSYSDYMKCEPIVYSNTVVKTGRFGFAISVYGNFYSSPLSQLVFDSAVSMADGVSFNSSSIYYLYVKDTGAPAITNIPPVDRTSDLRGYYHPGHPWRCIGSALTDGSTHFVSASSDFYNWSDSSGHHTNGSVNASISSSTAETIVGTATISSYGKPLKILLNNGLTKLICSSSSSFSDFTFKLYRDGTQVGIFQMANMGSTNTTFRYPTNFEWIDYNATPGLHTYNVSVTIDDAANSMTITGVLQGASMGGP